MKKVVFTLLVLIQVPVFGQNTNQALPEKKLLGFNTGLNYSNIRAGTPLPENAVLYNGLGFRLGIMLDYPINEHLGFSPKAELAFSNSKVRITNPDNSVNDYGIFGESLELMTHIIIKKGSGRLKPYILLGPNIRLPLYERPKFVGFDSNPDLAADIGFGFEKCFPKLFVAPEIRYSAGLFNVNKYPAVPSALYFHNLVFVVHFKG